MVHIRPTHLLPAAFLTITLIIISSLSTLLAQDTTSVQHVVKDTSFAAKVARVKEEGIKINDKSLKKFKSDQNTIRQQLLVDAIRTTTEKTKSYLAEIDTLPIVRELQKIERWSEVAIDGVFVNEGSAHSYRNLTTTASILRELHNRVIIRKNQTDHYEKELQGFRYNIDSLSADSALYNFSADSVVLIQYLKKLVITIQAIAPADSALDATLDKIRSLQIRINTTGYWLSSKLEQIDGYQKKLSDEIFKKEFPDIWGSVGYSRPFQDILSVSKKKGALVLWFYAQNNPFKLLLLCVLIFASTLFLRTLKKILRQEQLLRSDFVGQLVLRYPFLSATVLVLNLFQFIFTEPPFIVNALFWLISAACLTVIFSGFITRHWMMMWNTMFVLFFLACINNLVLQASRPERWGMLALATCTVLTTSYYLQKGKRAELREKLIVYFILLAIVLEFLAIIMNVSGRYNLSKTLMITGLSNIIVGILFLWTIRLINEGLALASSIYTKQERRLFYINFERVGEKSPTILYVLLVLGWVILMGKNVYAFKTVTDPLKSFFFEERTIGDYSFTISNLLVFFVVVSLSAAISKIVSFFASDKMAQHSNTGHERKPGLGSWILLVRVSIITIGLLLGLAASGFPMDRITIIIGALGLGVGLGLQTLVNNLVSGLIIAFEKPVNVGDVVEIGTQAGIMKSIGFRSSVVTLWTGADVVIPNGDLLNTHLVNWTLGGSRRRMEVVVGVSYGTDLENARSLILETLQQNDKILRIPEPGILFQDFNNSSIDVRILFWARDFRESFAVKSEVIISIDKAFKQHGITIPFPQRDIHIISPKETVPITEEKKLTSPEGGNNTKEMQS